MKNYLLEDIKRELDTTLDIAKVYTGASRSDDSDLDREEQDLYFYFNKTLSSKNYESFPIEKRSLAFMFFKRSLELKKMYNRHDIKSVLVDLSKS
ncbi:MAG: hypothetical protein KDC84_11605 [Crocinitomicaceae bacterium]|nr:hypothetical protein [Crocinitomicaceae bacterium]